MMKRMMVAMGIAAVALEGAAAAKPTYSLGNPHVTVVCNVTNLADYARLRLDTWALSNACSAGAGAAYFRGSDAGGCVPRKDIDPARPVRTLDSALAGFPVERNKPQYFLGDALTPPEDVDWEATYRLYLSRPELAERFLFDTYNRRVYVIQGGTAVFPWVVADGSGGVSTAEVTVIASPVSAERPKNVFWTDAEYGGSPVDLSGRHAALYGPSNLLAAVVGLDPTGTYVGGVMTSNEVIRSGVHIAGSALYAAGRLEGQFVLVYYDSPLRERIVDVQVVEVTKPSTVVMRGTVGTALKPSGRGYGIAGLTASVTSLDAPDNYGPYLYQHIALYNYSPRNRAVFPLRPTDDKTRNQTQIYWMETDNQGVSWPFEIDEYLVSWPEDIPVFVRSGDIGKPGAPIAIPGEYTAELQKYQEGLDGLPFFHATAPQDGAYSTYAEGRSLLKLSANDTVWFLPVLSVLRTNRSWFTLEPASAKVGEILSMRGGSVSGLAEGRTIPTDRSVPGFVHEPESDPVWNASLYSADGTGWKDCPSEVCPVTASMDPAVTNRIEVWWSSAFREEGMPARVTVPSLPQVYSIVWPETYETPQIAIASQEGSAGRSVCCADRTLVFDAADASLALPDAAYFGKDGCGAVMLWTKPYDATAAFAPSRLLTIGAAGRPSALVSLALARDGDGMKAVATVGGVTLEKGISDPRVWTHLAFAWSPSNAVLSAVGADGRFGSVTGAAPDAATRTALGGEVHGNAVGWTASDAASATAPMRMVDGICCWNRAHDLASPFHAAAAAFMRLDGTADGQMLCVPFSGPDELENILNGRSRRATDLVSGRTLTATGCLREEPGAPTVTGGVVIDSDVVPVVYRQTDPKAVGFNPNEEHAFVEAGRGGYVAWALRCDLNDAGSAAVSRPVALVQYAKAGRARMACFSVVPTNRLYSAFAGTCEAGLALPGPKPLTAFPDPWLKEDCWRNGRYGAEATNPYRDRKGQLWARAKGRFDIYMHYAQQNAFDWPAGLRTPEIGEAVPWLAYLDDPEEETRKPDGTVPHRWTWDVRWPTNVATMRIGQTLTDAADGLPEVWNAKSMAVIYPTEADVANPDDTVILADPTCARRARLGCRVSELAEIGLTAEPGGKLVASRGLYYFRDVSPSLANCLCLDPSDDSLVMRGCREDNAGGAALLFLNVLSETNACDVLALAKDYAGKPAYACLKNALDELVGLGVRKPTDTRAVARGGMDAEIVSTYAAPDHYALTAMGATNYVVTIENDATNAWCDAGNPINMHIFRVIPEYYTGRALTREDPLNLLSQVLDVFCTESFAGKAGDYVFDWRYAKPDAQGRTPDDFDAYVSKFAEKDGVGRTSFTVGGQGDTLANMVNTYWTCRYRAAETNSPAGRTLGTNTWSAWYSPPALAEGWIQRVLNNVTPFNQRMTDLYENPAETAVSMIQQAGGPYTGDVALNQDNLTSVGLVELYRTILSKAETMSVRLGYDDTAANQQLLLAAERLHDLYRVLGDEAYADAANPTVGFGSQYIADCLELEYGAASPSLFCFDNQVPTLLDEELALIRGRSCANAPDNTTGPYYNRLVWNFTKGITAGEVAYAVNYDIGTETTATIDAASAAKLYPQGHGDAYGHYLSALQCWYRLLRNPYFSWGDPAVSSINVADNAVNADYYEEAKFAEAAASVARTAKRAVELTALKHWRDRVAGTVGGGYLDTDGKTAFGYGEWASRGAFGALCNWAVANSLLPEAANTNGQGVAYADKGLLRIDRGTVAGIGEITSAADGIQRMEDRMDAGMNPLGLDENAVPFDLTPIGSAEDSTHFEQVRARAATAFANARELLERAQEYANRLRLIAEERTGVIARLDTMETDYTAQLIEIYGRPYADDVGAGKTYPEGYTGPDLYHYMWVNDLSDYGLADVSSSSSEKTYSYSITGYTKDGEIAGITAGGVKSSEVSTLTYTLSPDGLVVKNSGITGTRPANGELQQAYADFLVAYGAVKDAQGEYQGCLERLDVKLDLAMAQVKAMDRLGRVEKRAYGGGNDLQHYIDELRGVTISAAVMDGTADSLEVWLSTTDDNKISVTKSTGWVSGIYDGIRMAQASLEGQEATDNAKISELEKKLDNADRDYAGATMRIELWDGIEEAALAASEAARALNAAWRAMNAAQVQFSALVQKGESIREARELARRQEVGSISKMRYNDMFLRQVRNDALMKYDTAFDLAKRYAFLAAKAYGYETGSMPDDLVREILAARALGEADSEGNPIVSGHGDAGLAGALAKMDANWANLRTQLGINNPQSYATWFSLRHELFRILRGELGDEAWKTELSKHWTDDIRSNPDFLRHCQPFASRFGLAEKEPGLVITFETTVDFALNLFGKPLAYDDSQFDSSWFATKIASAGVWFENYNERTANYRGQETAFAATPNVYLVPVGTDRMRVPGSDGEEIAEFTVLDQTVPAPYPVTPAEIAEANWLPSYLQGEYAGVDKEARIRRHPSFRAYYGPEGETPSDDQLDAVRLTGRSVWNTKWMLVIPAGTLNSDREKALKAFIGGLDVNGDGQIDLKGVSDIRIGFRTYSYGGK